MDGELRKEMSALVKLNLTAGIDNEIYAEEYNRIGQTESFQSNRPVVTVPGQGLFCFRHGLTPGAKREGRRGKGEG